MKNNACVEFGGFVRTLRLQKDITGRMAAEKAGMLPSNFSKLEHGALAPPKDSSKLKLLAQAIQIESGSSDSERFFDLAAKATNTIPVDLADIISEHEAAPLLLRTVGNKRLTKEQVAKLVALVRGQSVTTKKKQG